MKVSKVLFVLAVAVLAMPVMAQSLVTPGIYDAAPMSFENKTPTGHVPGALVNMFGDDCSAGADLGVVSNGSTADYDTTGMACEDYTAGCPATPCFGLSACNGFNPDAVAKFRVNVGGLWRIQTCGSSTHDNELMVRTACGGGTCIGADDDNCTGSCGSPWNARLQTTLLAGTDYWLTVGGYSSEGSGTVTFTLLQILCTQDSDCNDGVYCNGVETCNVGTGACIAGTNPCLAKYACDEATDSCIACVNWHQGPTGGFFLPGSVITIAGDDFGLRADSGRQLVSYSMDVFGRVNPGSGQVVGQPYFLDMEIWDWDVTGVPLAPVAGTACTVSGTIMPGGSPADHLVCAPNGGLPTGVDIPLDPFSIGIPLGWMMFASNPVGVYRAGPALVNIADPNPKIGNGLDGALVYGQRVYFIDGTVYISSTTGAGWGDATVCTVPLGACCLPDGTCANTEADECAALGGQYQGDDTATNPGLCADLADGDGDGSPDSCDQCPADPLKVLPGQCGCGNLDTDTDSDGVADCNDNCDNDPNPLQENSDTDDFGDACDNCDLVDNNDQANSDGDTLGNACDNCPNVTNENQADNDSDGVGNVCDNCPNVSNASQTDSDGDGNGNACDICPGFNDFADADGDGVPDGCDQCPGSDDGAQGALGDDDGDGVINCNDVCNGANDAVFAPGCIGQIPTVSEWGVLALALLLLAAGKVYFGRRTALN